MRGGTLGGMGRSVLMSSMYDKGEGRRAVRLARYRDQPTPFRFAHRDEAVTELMRIADAGGPTVAVIDEFPFLAKASPSPLSIIQRALDPAAQHINTPVRLLLCGSALPFMGKLLSGNAPLRGRAGLELVVPTLDFRLAAEFWQITDPRTALLTNAVVGGTPAYRREFTQGDTPAGPYALAAWLTGRGGPEELLVTGELPDVLRWL